VNPPINALVQAAGAAASQGRWQEAEQLWQRVRAIDPNHPQALYSLGVHAYRRGALIEALQTLQAAHNVAPRDPVVLLSVSVVLRDMGDINGELRAIDAALAADPYFLSGLLARAAHFEKHRGRKLAAPIYRNALKVAPPEPHWPDPLRSQLQHARDLVARHNEEMVGFLTDRMATHADALTPFEAARWREAGAIVAGISQPYPSVCNRLLVPRLPAIPFFDRKDFGWVEELESQTEAITSELQALWQREQAQFKPYVAYQPGVPVNQWHELNHSTRWSSYFLWRDGEPQADHQQQCPVTTAVLNKVEKADIGGLCPNAMFSALAPHTAIPPHHGETNARLVVHLPLIVPPNCSYRVGFERRQWEVGTVLIFDDSIEHEARNDSDELRVVLIFDVWNPLLSPAERDMVRSLSAATREFHAQE
jgi:aspartate beta-hydroxylase